MLNLFLSLLYSKTSFGKTSSVNFAFLISRISILKISLISKKLYEPPEGEIGTDSAKQFVALCLGLPLEPEETIRLPAPALSVLRKRLSLEGPTGGRKNSHSHVLINTATFAGDSITLRRSRKIGTGLHDFCGATDLET